MEENTGEIVLPLTVKMMLHVSAANNENPYYYSSIQPRPCVLEQDILSLSSLRTFWHMTCGILYTWSDYIDFMKRMTTRKKSFTQDVRQMLNTHALRSTADIIIVLFS